jgi:hypothetical protein
MNLLGDNIDTIKKNTKNLFDASKEVGLAINVGKTKNMLLSRHQNVGQNREIKIANRLFENLSQFKYLGTTVTNDCHKQARKQRGTGTHEKQKDERA